VRVDACSRRGLAQRADGVAHAVCNHSHIDPHACCCTGSERRVRLACYQSVPQTTDAGHVVPFARLRINLIWLGVSTFGTVALYQLSQHHASHFGTIIGAALAHAVAGNAHARPGRQRLG
jgi:hypothetical protein